ncbi:MAG: stage II sporulation protein D [Anaerovoracaceae bacterium]|jgi:stage II sporulation protein D
MKGRKHKRRPMSRKKMELLILSTIICMMVVFCLVILPFFMVWILDIDPNRRDDTVKSTKWVTVYNENTNKTETLELEAYVAGVVAGEMPAKFEPEALKAQAVAARTYALSKINRAKTKGNSADHPNAPLCNGTHCQVYRSEEELLKLKGQAWIDNDWPKILDAVKVTSGQVMYYKGAIVEQPLFHSASGGQTENSEDVFVAALPYLRSVKSNYEKDAPHQNETISISFNTFTRKVKATFGANSVNPNSVKIVSRTEGGRVEKLRVGDKTITGRNIRDLFGLRSANFTIAFDANNNIIFTTKGYGHGVGMSQWGANGMAQEGFDYKKILKHYYSGVSIESI